MIPPVGDTPVADRLPSPLLGFLSGERVFTARLFSSLDPADPQ